VRRLGLLLLLCAFATFGAAASASANSGSIRALSDVGGGSMSISVSVSVDKCGDNDGEFCFWYYDVQERHSTLGCYPDHVISQAVSQKLEETPDSVSETATFRPFFPRSARLCLYIFSVGQPTQLADELLYTVPSGYGLWYSTAFRCSSFSNRGQASYYLQLYPSDPSDLDLDNDGLPCEGSPCPCGIDLIPPEPPRTPSVPPALPPTAPSPLCVEGHHNVELARARVKSARQRLRKAQGTRAARKKRAALNRRLREARQTEHDQILLCGTV
jgi:hypothetical protein